MHVCLPSVVRLFLSFNPANETENCFLVVLIFCVLNLDFPLTLPLFAERFSDYCGGKLFLGLYINIAV